jgi:tRNA 2-thiouridine synthesizing protein E
MERPVDCNKIVSDASLHKVDTDCDDEGYLRHHSNWTESIASEIARREKIILSSGHWEVIYVMQELYLRYKVSPPTRILAKEMIKRYGKTRGSSQYLFRLFPGGLIRQAAKISGLPKSVRCL